MKVVCAVFLMTFLCGAALSQFNTNYLPASIQSIITSTIAVINAGGLPVLATSTTEVSQESETKNAFT